MAETNDDEINRGAESGYWLPKPEFRWKRPIGTPLPDCLLQLWISVKGEREWRPFQDWKEEDGPIAPLT